MRRTKLTFAYLLIATILFLVASYFFGNILTVDPSGGTIYSPSSMFSLAFIGNLGGTTYINSDGVITWVTYECDQGFSNYIYVGCLAILFFNSFRMVRKIKNSSKIAFLCVRDLIYSTIAIFLVINLLTYNVNQTMKYLVDGNWVDSYTNSAGQVVENNSGIITIWDSGKINSFVFINMAAYGLIILFKLVVFSLCLRYGDWSPIEAKVHKKKKAKEKTEPKTKIVESVQETKHEEKHIFYTGPVPKNTDKIFEGLTDGAIEEPEKINGTKQQVKTTINIKNSAPKTPKKEEVKSAAPATEKKTVKTETAPAEKTKETITQVVFTTEVKAKPQEEFTGLDLFADYKPDSTNNPFMQNDQKDSDNVHETSFDSTDYDVLQNVISSSFDSKSLFLDDHDEYYGNDDDDDDSPFEEEVPDAE